MTVNKIFGIYTSDNITINDEGLAKYINLATDISLHSGGRFGKKHFGKKDVNIVERLINKMMRTEKYTGKKMSAYKVVKNAFEIIENRTKHNPIQSLILAIQNAAPREEIIRLRYGGMSVPKAVDVAPARRIDLALRNISKGANKASFKKKKGIEYCLADEILLAAKNDLNSFAGYRLLSSDKTPIGVLALFRKEKISDEHSCIDVTDLSVCFGKELVLNRFSFSVMSGQKVLICGHSGSGKSTILKSLLGFVKPKEGTINPERWPV